MQGSDLYFMAKWYILPFPVLIPTGTYQSTIECGPLFKHKINWDAPWQANKFVSSGIIILIECHPLLRQRETGDDIQ